MGFMDELRKITRPYAEDDDDFEEDFGLEDEDRPARQSRASRSDRRQSNIRSTTPDGYDDVLDELGGSARSDSYGSSYGTAGAARRRTSPLSDSGSKVVNIHAGAQMQVVLVKPDRFDNVSEIAEHLRNKHAVILNLEATNKEIARRLVDFLSGCAYALDGKIKKIAISTYLITPYNMDIIGDLLDELENSGVYL